MGNHFPFLVSKQPIWEHSMPSKENFPRPQKNGAGNIFFVQTDFLLIVAHTRSEYIKFIKTLQKAVKELPRAPVFLTG